MARVHDHDHDDHDDHAHHHEAHHHEHAHDHDDHGHSHGIGHHHGHGGGTGRLKIALVGTALLAILELIGGIVSHSLALMSDAAHVSMDVVALAIALVAGIQSMRPATERQTFGFARLEILAALANSGLLLGITVLIAIEAVHRFMAPELPAGGIMIAIASVGLVVNLSIGLMLLRGERNLNMRAALLHVGGDALGAIAVVIGGILIGFTNAAWIDPLLSLLVAAIIVAGVVNVFREATQILLESAPNHAPLPEVRAAMQACSGVVAVHDLHVWTLGSGSHALSAHIVVDDRRVSEASALVRRVNDAMLARFAIAHCTLQVECENCAPGEEIVCTQVPREALSGAGT
jgi:cobalt-zinc-cadmium efflux system protein